MTKSLIPSIENQAIILERLVGNYLSWIDSHVNLVLELTWEMSFNNIRKTVIYLNEYWYIESLETEKLNEIYVKVLKKWILYYEEMFEQKSEGKNVSPNKLDLNAVSGIFKNFKNIAVWIIALLALFWISSWSIEDFFADFWINISLNQLFNEGVSKENIGNLITEKQL